MTFSKVMLSGQVSTTPEKRFTPNNTAVANFDLTVNFPGRQGQPDEPYPIKVTCWAQLADTAAEQLQSGHHVVVEGKLMSVVHQSPEGIQKKTFEIDASNLYRMGAEAEDLSRLQATGGDSAPAPRPQPQQQQAPAPAAAPAQSGGMDFPPEESLTEDDIPF